LLLAALVRLAAVVGLVEPRPLEQHGGPRAKEALEFLLLARRALGQRLLGERLQLLEAVPATLAQILVSRHSFLRVRTSGARVHIPGRSNPGCAGYRDPGLSYLTPSGYLAVFYYPEGVA